MEYLSYTLRFAGEVIYFYLPVLLCNAAVFCVWIRLGVDIPLDCYASWNGKRIIGSHRSVACIIFWPLFSAAIAAMQGRALEGFYLGAGAMTGTDINSFLKRRFGIAPGAGLALADDTDFVIGASLFYASAYQFNWHLLLGAVLILGVVHRVTNIFLRPLFERFSSSSA